VHEGGSRSEGVGLDVAKVPIVEGPRRREGGHGWCSGGLVVATKLKKRPCWSVRMASLLPISRHAWSKRSGLTNEMPESAFITHCNISRAGDLVTKGGRMCKLDFGNPAPGSEGRASQGDDGTPSWPQ